MANVIKKRKHRKKIQPKQNDQDLHAIKSGHLIWFAPCFACSGRDACPCECNRFKQWSKHLKNNG